MRQFQALVAAKLCALAVLFAVVASPCHATDASPFGKGLTALHKAALAGDVERLAELLRKSPSTDPRTSLGTTPLHLAVLFGHVDATVFLLARGADILARDLAGNDALSLATTPLFKGTRLIRVPELIRLIHEYWQDAIRSRPAIPPADPNGGGFEVGNGRR